MNNPHKPIKEIVNDLVSVPYDEMDEQLLKLDFDEKFSMDGADFELIYKKFLNTKIESVVWDFLITYSEHPLPIKIANLLIDRDLCITPLGHSFQELAIMWRLADLIDEAAITLGVWLFTKSIYEDELFKPFLEKHGHNYWVMQCLAYRDGASAMKKNLFMEFVLKHERRIELEHLINVLESEKKALSANITAEEIDQLYRMGEPKVLRALAVNPLTPKEILNELIQISNVKLAKVIRENARKNLRQTQSRSPTHRSFKSR